MSIPAGKSVLLFDGICVLCNHTVPFVVKHDRHKKILMAALQSEAGQQLLLKYGLPLENFKTFVFIENSVAYTRSTAALKFFRALGGFYKILYAFMIIPRPLRDWVYDLVSKNRYHWFGRRDICLVPTPEIQDRFLR